MMMLRWMYGVKKKDKIRKERMRGSVKVTPVTKKIAEKRIKWYGQCKSRDEEHVPRRMADAPVGPLPRKRRRGRQKTRWKESCK